MMQLDNANIQVMNRNMVDSASLSSQFEANSHISMPDVPKSGAIVRISYAGACQPEGIITKKNRRPKFPGNEVAGVIHDICNTIPNSNIIPGEKVILFPDEQITSSGYKEYIAVSDANNIVQVPNELPLEVAAMLPGCGLSAYMAILRAKPHVEYLQQVKSCVNVMIVGAGAHGLWTIKLAKHIMGSACDNVHMFVADNSIDKLLTAQDHGCFDIIHWNEEDYEEFIVERTLDSCRGGMDIVIDFVGTPRTVHRSLKVLNREGLVLVASDAASEVSISLNSLAAKQQSILGIPQGTVNNLRSLINMVTEGSITPPQYSVHPVEDANSVFGELCDCRITGRAILKFSNNSTNTLDNN